MEQRIQGKMMNEKLKYGLIGGSIGLLSYLIISFTFQFVFTRNISCIECGIILFGINFLPLIFKIKGYLIYFISSIFYFLVGVLIGYLVLKFKK